MKIFWPYPRITLNYTPMNDRTKTMWLIGSLGVDRRKLNAWRRLFHGGVFVEPHMPELKEFRYE